MLLPSLILAVICVVPSLAQTTRPVSRDDIPPAAEWDFHPKGQAWTKATMQALAGHGQALLQVVPDDIAHWCPAYEAQDARGRAAFWTSLLSSLAGFESTWKPAAVGAGKWYGLVQIAPATARGYGCVARTGQALKDGPANLSCAVRIWATTVKRDNAVAFKDGKLAGIAADWGPMRFANKREKMSRFTRKQRYCQRTSSPRPLPKS